ncbi:hypothetical protein NDU88_002446 [Pleurodeles waltl]|uniref:Uncharacterized protein n=1 Tax=Pleurodeles waltl TaxID=8319 RepID=A0AAV7KZ01_PLEWA|nr:hypothetical protein NDU88_002446 [Pleurodeles waltl]
MGRDKPPHKEAAQTEMDQYTTPTAAGFGVADGRLWDMAGFPPLTDMAVLLKAIQESREAVEFKVDGI